MTGGLQHVEDDSPLRCKYCSREAVGPCASCGAMVCGACCTLTEGGVKTYAICLECDRKKGNSLLGAWKTFLLWLFAPIAALAIVVALLAWLTQR